MHEWCGTSLVCHTGLLLLPRLLTYDFSDESHYHKWYLTRHM